MFENSEEKFIAPHEASEFLGIEVRQIYYLAERGVIPCYKLGRRLRFKRSELQAALQKKKKNYDFEFPS